AQRNVIRRALRAAGLEPADVSCVEAHGSGTPLGDSIELGALNDVFGLANGRRRPGLVRSGKRNLRHPESAAGIAGFIKVLLEFERELIAPHLHFHRLNPGVSLVGSPLRIASAAAPWTRSDGRRIAGVSSFGLSGTNAHVVVEEPPAPASSPS